VRSAVFTDAVIMGYLNRSLAKLYDLLIQKWADYYLVETTLNTTAAQEYVTLPAAFYKLRALDLRSGSSPYYSYTPCKRFELAERNHYHRGYDAGYGPAYYYRLEAGDPVNGTTTPNKLRLIPTPTGTDTLRLFYIPHATKFTAGADTFDTINDYDDLLIQRALLYADEREERPLQERLAIIQKLEMEIGSAADGRDGSEPPYLADLEGC
jgi:hypothetical protein